MPTELVKLSQKELKHHEVIRKALDGKYTNRQAAEELNLTVRQVQRLKIRVKENGAEDLVHKSRGKIGKKKINPETIEQAVELIKTNYWDFGPTFASEKLLENHEIKLGIETVRQTMIAAGLWDAKPRKEKAHYRAWRERKECFGDMEQFDGSYHDWFEGRLLNADGQPVTETCLLAAIDDATGKLTKLKFDDSEGVVPVNTFWLEYVNSLGKPGKIYLDRYSTYKVNAKHLFNDLTVLTQFERAMKELDVVVIHANSPQGKGRVERLFETLQDRLVKEFRLAGINTIAEANKFLEEIFILKFNSKFSVVPRKPDDAHTPLSEEEIKRLDNIFSIQFYRAVNNDFTIRFKNQWLQLAELQPTLVLRQDGVIVEEHLNGSIHVKLRDKYLSFTVLPERPQKVKMYVTGLTKEKQIWKPPMSHPWKKLSFEKNQRRLENSGGGDISI
jgi:transposase